MFMRGKEFVNWQLRFWHFAIPTTVFVLCIYAVAEMRCPLGRVANLLLWVSRMDPFVLVAYLRSASEIHEWVWIPILVMPAGYFVARFVRWVDR
jgi:hypothetical protein